MASLGSTQKISPIISLVPTLQRCVTRERHCPQLSLVGAGHARDEEAKAKHCSQNIAGMARSYGVIVLNCGQ